jgi:K+-sensing histidine kinase KdpD
MRDVTVRGLRNRARQLALCNLALGLVTVFGYNLHINPATVVLMYVLIVMLQSLGAGFISSAIVSAIAAAYLAYFFFPPIFSFRISDPANVLALFAFLIVAQVTA